MEMIKAQHAGFCFGVQRAVDRVFSLLHERQDAHIYTLGDLIHNPHITARLSQGGVRSIGPDSLDTVLEQALSLIHISSACRWQSVPKSHLLFQVPP